MSALLYYSISSNLSDDEINKVNQQVNENRRKLKNLTLNSKKIVCKQFINGTLVF